MSPIAQSPSATCMCSSGSSAPSAGSRPTVSNPMSPRLVVRPVVDEQPVGLDRGRLEPDGEPAVEMLDLRDLLAGDHPDAFVVEALGSAARSPRARRPQGCGPPPRAGSRRLRSGRTPGTARHRSLRLRSPRGIGEARSLSRRPGWSSTASARARRPGESWAGYRWRGQRRGGPCTSCQPPVTARGPARRPCPRTNVTPASVSSWTSA